MGNMLCRLASILGFLKRKNICIPGPLEIIKLFAMRRSFKLIDIGDFSQHLSSPKLFCFATGKSLAYLDKNLLSKSKDLNTIIFSTGVVKYTEHFNVLPKAWFIHNEDSVLMTLEQIKDSKILANLLQERPLFVFVPKNSSISKNCHISSNVIRKLRRLDLNFVFVLYNENYRNISLDSDISEFKITDRMRGFAGTNVETAFIPLAIRLGCNELFFSGVDHIDHGHFWDYSSAYVDKYGNKISISDIFTQEFMKKSFIKSQILCNYSHLSVFRLTKGYTRLTHYEYISLSSAIDKHYLSSNYSKGSYQIK